MRLLNIINPAVIEKSIKKLSEVKGAKVIYSEGEISEVHILASDQKSPKQLIRDIESIVMVDHNIKIDHQVISIAQLSDEDLYTNDNSRLVINGFSKSFKNKEMEIKIELKAGKEIYKGKADGLASSINRLQLFSRATLDAVQNYLGEVCNLLPGEIKKVSIANREAILVSVIILDDKEENTFLGIAAENDEKELAVIKATLNAINRRLTVLHNS